ncbi:MAG TPA: hypothetical protein VG268_11850, partial [Streptosporangiaceae bacterium]|nr:hypothetical protein [Streptosporangiaceae bacterium]
PIPGAPAADGNDIPGLISPATVASPRSVTCGAECAARPCTLRDMRSAQRALERNLGIVLWAELAVLAHLTGWPTPIPQVPLLDLLRAMPPRLRDCALSHAVDAAVASRTPAISGRVSPIGLASHVGDAMRARLVSGTSTCEKDEPQWLAPASPGAQRAVAFGLGTPSAIERVTGASVTDEDFQPQVAGHLEQFVDCRWPLLYLTGTPSEAPAK